MPCKKNPRLQQSMMSDLSMGFARALRVILNLKVQHAVTRTLGFVRILQSTMQ